MQNQSQIMHSSMDSNPPSHQSEPRLSRIDDFSYEAEELPHLSLDLVPYSPKKTSSPQISDSIPLQELLLSPLPARRSKSRTVERIEMDEEPVDPIGSRRRCKSRAASMGLLGCASPRNGLRARRRLEQENREEKDVAVIEEKARKRRQSNRSRKEKLSLVPSVPSSSSSPKTNDDDQSNLDRIGKLIFDLIMWNDVAKSSFWFGFGSLCFLSSCFGGGLSFSLFSTVSQLGLFILGVSFLFNSFSQRDKDDKKEVNLKEEDIVGAFRVMLPAANLVIVKTRKFFSGEPSMTLKVAPFLLFGAKYGHLITLWRVFATGKIKRLSLSSNHINCILLSYF
ncbi:hypothetical protein HHK36_023616 [Tetracentron sinense]|uniref:Reticulon domain-containing protein n=1 Tax=Tetracentron sinense TaxID=13715 RepID=A0A834YSP9_TETSI|nr:hypothetical protein HHK36_023616 [Tetracentron sinense]